MDEPLSPQAFAHSLSPEQLAEFTHQQPQCDDRGWLISGCPYPPEKPLIYIKYGVTEFSMRDSEARTQHWAYEALEKLPPESRCGVRIPKVYRVIDYLECTWILMELVPGKTIREYFNEKDAFSKIEKQCIDLIEKGIRLLLSLPVPEGSTPGPVGGGFIRHPLFNDFVAPIQYDSLEMLQKHLNNVATMRIKTAPTVQLEPKLHLVFADLYEGNFMLSDTGDMYIIDFEQASFLPLSFMSYALIQAHPLCIDLEKRFDRDMPQDNMEAMKLICTYFVMSTRRIGLPV